MTGPSTESGASAGATLGLQSGRLGELLVRRGVVSREQIERALRHKRERCPRTRLGEVLVELGLVEPDVILETLAEASGVPFVRLTADLVETGAVSAVPKQVLERHPIVPLQVGEDTLRVAMADFANIYLIDELKRLTGREIEVVAATAEAIGRVRDELSSEQVDVDIQDVIGDLDGDLQVVEADDTDESAELEVAAADSPVIKLVNGIILSAVRDRASDIHIELHEGGAVVRYRIDGVLHDRFSPPTRLYAAVVSRIKIMSNLDISERRQPQDGTISVVVANRHVQLRVSTMPGNRGEKVVMRIMDAKQGLLALEDLGFSAEMLGGLLSVIHQPNGVVLVTGPTGSGKSTTLYGCLREIFSEHINISTVEDPIEFDLERVNQFQVNAKAGFTFASALRSLLRQDPDVVMVGEIRDRETAQIATQAALTGHLVLSTLHTNDAPGAVTRLINIGVEPYLVAAALRGVLAQRLVKKICPHCKRPAELTASMRRLLTHFGETASRIERVYEGAGCSRCRQTGYLGRMGIYELLIPDDAFLEAVSEGRTLQELRRMSRAIGCRPLRDDGIEKVAEGVVSFEALFDVVSRTEELIRPIQPEVSRAG